MARIPTLAALAVAAGLASSSPAGAQQTYVTYPQGTTYARPGVPYYAAPRDNRAVLPAFSQRGGIGTTPFLGNTRGLGGYSVNYDAPRSAAVRPARRGWFFRRNP